MIDTVALLEEMVAVDSTSARSNLPILGVLERHARALGLTTRRQLWNDAAGVEKGNLVAHRGGETGGLSLVGHTDCVPFDAGWTGALRPAREDGKVVGRGAADTKAFLAAMLTAASRTQAKPFQLVFTADEEVGCLGARRLAEEGAVKPRVAIVGEPTRMIPVLGHKGYCLAEVTVRGIEGHSAYPETGASAILAAGRVLREVERIAGELRAEGDPAFAPPHTTLNVGVISGGKAKNVIPGVAGSGLDAEASRAGLRADPGRAHPHRSGRAAARCGSAGPGGFGDRRFPARGVEERAGDDSVRDRAALSRPARRQCLRIRAGRHPRRAPER